MFPIALAAGEFAALALGIFGVSGIIFTALKFNRDDTTAVVNQQTQIVGDMKALNDELRTTTAELRTERDGLRAEVDRLTEQIKRLTQQLRETMRRRPNGD